MSFLSQVGTFLSPAGTGTQTVSLSNAIWGGATPKAVIIWGRGGTGEGFATGVNISIGMAVSSTSRCAVSIAATDNSPSSETARRHTNAKVISLVLSNATVFHEADFSSFGADQFTINWTTNAYANRPYNYLCLGGTDLTGVYIDEIQTPTSTGSQAYTGVGFRPTAMISLNCGNSSAPANSSTFGVLSMGMSDGTNEFVLSFYSGNGLATSESKRQQITTDFTQVGFNASLGAWDSASVTFDADGYTLDWPVADGTSRYSWNLCLAGPQMKVLTDTQGTSTGNKDTAIGFTGKAALLASVMGEVSSSIQTDARFGLGAMDASANQAFVGIVDEDNQETTDVDRYHDPDEIFKMLNHAQGVDAAATGSWSGTDLRLNWTTADATARQWGGLVFGDAAASTVAPTSHLYGPLVGCLGGPI